MCVCVCVCMCYVDDNDDMRMCVCVFVMCTLGFPFFLFFHLFSDVKHDVFMSLKKRRNTKSFNHIDT